jgi:hypothetical protein
MPGPNIPGSRATEYDVERFEQCEACKKPVDVFVRVFKEGEPWYWCLPCLQRGIELRLSIGKEPILSNCDV